MCALVTGVQTCALPILVRTGEEGPKGISCLVIEKDMPGVSFGAQERKLGWHSQPTAQVMFDSVRVPAENLVGAEGEGFRIAMMGLDGGRLNRSEEHTSELQSLMRISYAVFCLKKHNNVLRNPTRLRQPKPRSTYHTHH